MDRQSVNPSYSLAMAQAICNAFGTRPAAALAAALEVHLWQDPAFNPQPSTLPAAFATAEATYTGYAAATGVVLTSPVNLNADAQGAIGSALFTTTAPVTVSNVIWGYWLQSAGVVVTFEKFVEGQQVPIANEGDFLDLLVALPTQYAQNASAA